MSLVLINVIKRLTTLKLIFMPHTHRHNNLALYLKFGSYPLQIGSSYFLVLALNRLKLNEFLYVEIFSGVASG